MLPEQRRPQPLFWPIVLVAGLLGLHYCIQAAITWQGSIENGFIGFLTRTVLYEPFTTWAWVNTVLLLFQPLAGLALVAGAALWFWRRRAGCASSPLELPEQLLLRGSALATLLLLVVFLQFHLGTVARVLGTVRTGGGVDISQLQFLLRSLDISALAAPLLIFLILLNRRLNFRLPGPTAAPAYHEEKS